MSNETIERKKLTTNIAVIGHIDHGKTMLTAAIPTVLAKTYGGSARQFDPENSTSGIKVSASHVAYDTPTRHYEHVDWPSHKDIVKGMITGRQDGVILVVSATDGPMPLTREHILLCRQVGVPTIIVFLNKCDKVDDEELLELVEMEIRDILSQYDYPGHDTPVIRGSVLKALGGNAEWEVKIVELAGHLDSAISTIAGQGTIMPHTQFECLVYMSSKDEGGPHTPFSKDYRPQFCIQKEEVTGLIELPEGVDMAMPGDHVQMVVTLAKSVAFDAGQRFLIYEGGRTVGAGVVSKVIA